MPSGGMPTIISRSIRRRTEDSATVAPTDAPLDAIDGVSAGVPTGLSQCA